MKGKIKLKAEKQAEQVKVEKKATLKKITEPKTKKDVRTKS